MNTSDSYVEDNELWGNSRDYALRIGQGGSYIAGNQIVPGSQGGIYLLSQDSFLQEILRIVGNYFDGSYQSITTGHGIYAPANNGITNSVIADNTFWRLNGMGVRIETLYNSRLVDNIFEDCASADSASTPDIYIKKMSATKISNSHIRTLIAPKTGVTRVNLSPAVQVTADPAGAMNEVMQTIATPAVYVPSQIGNPQYVVDHGRILNRTVDQFFVNGTTQIKNGIAYLCVNGAWKAITT